MIRVNQIKMPIEHSEEELRQKVCSILRVKPVEVLSFQIRKKSIDARKKPDLFYLYGVDVALQDEKRIIKKLPRDCSVVNDMIYQIPKAPSGTMKKPVIVGEGPAGLFCAYIFALAKVPAVLIERGDSVSDRMQAVDKFWKEHILDPESNVQFGEGGAGTFSDGKLNTLVKDKTGKNRFVLETFVKFGAPEQILYDAKPHIGTDILQRVIVNMRRFLEDNGIEVCFRTKLTDVRIEDKAIKAVVLNNGERTIETDDVVLAIGHSARDTFEMLHERAVAMAPKPFAVGFRVEHPRHFIDISQYGERYADVLPAASYKLTAQTSENRGVYTFCMCPGGYVVNASSEPGRLAVNGMSYSGRNGDNSNSAIIVTVGPEDFQGEDVLGGMHFQRQLEEKAYQLGKGKIPVETFGEFERAITGEKEAGSTDIAIHFAEISPAMKGNYEHAPVHEILPESLNRAFVEGMHDFGKRLDGYDDPLALVSGIESRTSSPIKMMRDEKGYSESVTGLYPCGEGAGYAGGIMSAAMDGILIAEKILQNKG